MFYLGLLRYLDYVMLLGDVECQHIVNFLRNTPLIHSYSVL